MHRGEPGSKQLDGEPMSVCSPVVDKCLQWCNEDVTQYPDINPRLVHPEDLRGTVKISELGADCLPGKTSKPENHLEHLGVVPEDMKNDHSCKDKIIQKRKDTSPHQMPEDLPNEKGGTSKELSNVLASEELKPIHETGEKSSITKSLGLHREIVMGLPSCGQYETLRNRMSAKNSKSLEGGGKRNSLFPVKNHVVRSSLNRERVMRSGSQEKSKETASFADANSEPVVGRRKRKRGREKGERRESDEYLRIRNHLRYLLNRINYEQSLITAYSSEGWKGLSLEKLKPEKELERATKEILRRKLKIRDLFHHLDALSAEGRLPKSLFDSEGEIASEDIFCAKCGSKDLSADNDIILCDGVCDRGFHQCCLEPPLLKEDIPPGDEGWLCPGCDCRVDCIDLLNESQGARLSINDSWEKIFPEAAAAAAAAGGNQDPNLGLPSDDSDDDDYEPDAPDDNKMDDDDDESDDGDDDKEDQEDESSDESDFTSASDEMVSMSKDEQNMGLPSDDSEDDDYDPDVRAHDDEDFVQESSGSDFTSDSEDLGAVLKDNGSYQEDDVTTPGESSGQKSQLHQNKKQSVAISGSDGSADVPRGRSVERLDYKKLYDEAFGNVPSSSSDDEDWDKTARTAGEEDSMSADEMSGNEHTEPLKQSSAVAEEHGLTKPRRKSRRADKNKNLDVPQEGAERNGTPGGKSGSSARRQRDVKFQRLFQVFQENRYPDNATKENLARELEMTVKQVNNWFSNRRSPANGTLVKRVSKKDVKMGTTSKAGQGETSIAGCSQRVTENESFADQSRTQESMGPGSQKRRRS